MIPDSNIDKLTEAMSVRKDGHSSPTNCPSGPESFILFLGNECARAAKVPDLASIADRVIEIFGQGLPRVKGLGTEEVLESLYPILDKMSGGVAYTMLQSFYTDIPVPLFYQDLAQLVKAGYFNRIITTNFDTLLEQALAGAGMQAGFDYYVTSLGIKSEDGDDAATVPPRSSASETEADEGREPTHIIKLHGDLARRQINLSPSRIEKVLRSQRGFVRGELKGDMVIVGYTFESEPVNHWLTSTSTTREQLWWVRQQPPEREIDEWAPLVTVIEGEVGRPDMFFNQLVLRLLRRPVLESLGKSFKDYVAGSELEFEAAAEVAGGTGLEEGDDYGEKDPTVVELRDRIKRSQAVLFSHDQSFPTGERPPSVQTQIDYQKRHIAKFEDRLRSNPDCVRHIHTLVDRIVSHAEGAAAQVRPRTLEYLRSQRKAVLEEYGHEQPDQQVVGAAIGVLVLLGDRLRVELGEEVVALETLRALASYVPSLAARGVLQ